MPKASQRPSHPGLVVLRRTDGNRWELLGEVPRVRGLTARAARTAAVMTLTQGKARPGEVYAAIVRSEWRLALDWEPSPRA